MKTKSILRSAAGMAAFTMTCTAQAGTPAQVVAPADPSPSGWEFSIEPYGWLTALKGTAGVAYRRVEVDNSFSDIFKHLEMAAALDFEARNGRWGIIADGFYANLSGSSVTAFGPFSSVSKVDVKQFIGEIDGAYRMADGASGFVDVYGGIRYNSLSVDINSFSALPPLNFSLSKDRSWTDPVIGVRGQWNINEKFYLAGKADVGGFGVGSDIAWSVQGTLGYNFTRTIAGELGYRYFKTEYSDRGFTYDIAQSGLYTGVTFKF